MPGESAGGGFALDENDVAVRLDLARGSVGRIALHLDEHVQRCEMKVDLVDVGLGARFALVRIGNACRLECVSKNAF